LLSDRTEADPREAGDADNTVKKNLHGMEGKEARAAKLYMERKVKKPLREKKTVMIVLKGVEGGGRGIRLEPCFPEAKQGRRGLTSLTPGGARTNIGEVVSTKPHHIKDR